MKIDFGEGVLLSEENFNSWNSKMLRDVLKETHAMHMLYVLRGANRLGVQTDWVEGDVIDIDKPIRVADIIDLESYTDVAEYKDIVKWQQIRNTLEIGGFIQSIKAYEPRRASEVDTSQGEKIKGSLDGMIRILKNENYGETSDVFIDPIDNGFLDALMVYKAGRILDSTYNIIEGPQTGVENTARQYYLLYGLIPLNSIDTDEMAGSAANYEIQTQVGPMDVLINIASAVTIAGIVSSRTVTVTK